MQPKESSMDYNTSLQLLRVSLPSLPDNWAVGLLIKLHPHIGYLTTGSLIVIHVRTSLRRRMSSITAELVVKDSVTTVLPRDVKSLTRGGLILSESVTLVMREEVNSKTCL